MTDWVLETVAVINEQVKQQAIDRQNQLTKPQGSLGRLESIAIRLAAMQGRLRPQADKVFISVFAADHGIAGEGVSAYPQSVTQQMVGNFANGGAAINVLARQLGATLEIVNLGTVENVDFGSAVQNQWIAPGTKNFSVDAAMTQSQLAECISCGRAAAERAAERDASLFIGGEMGIGNTTSASAITAALLLEPVEQIVGNGTGISQSQKQHKTELITQGLILHRDQMNTALDVLQKVGGFEIAALTGSYIRCAQLGIPVIVDGFIAAAAALAACRINHQVQDWMIFSHASTEPGLALILEELGQSPILQLGMRLGEGSGAAMSVCVIRNALALFNEMATFSQAGVSEKNG